MSVRFAFGEKKQKPSDYFLRRRTKLILFLFSCGGILIFGRLFQLQILEGKTYKILASGQHEVQAALVPERGTIYLKDRWDGKLHPIAKDKDVWQVYAIVKDIEDQKKTAEELAEILGLPIPDLEQTFASSSYAVLSKDASREVVDALREKRIQGIGAIEAQSRFYPEQGMGGQILGFVNQNDQNQRVGRYGIESSFNEELAGEYGSIQLEKDAAGRRLTIGSTKLVHARDGSDVVLTLDRTIQYEACRQVQEAVSVFKADSGSIVIMDPDTGAIWALCSAPDFNPATYNEVDDISVFNNPVIFDQFEPGSIFKPLTMAAGVDSNKVSPDTTYIDKGEEEIDDFTIRNSDKRAHGVKTMTEVLQESLNLGTIFIQRQLGKDLFRKYVEAFGFGVETGIEIGPEVGGDIRPLSKPGEIFAATASFGQGIAVTSLQMVAAFGALGNGGQLFKPYIVQEIIHPDGTKTTTKPTVVRQVISSRTSRLVSGMMVTVVEQGHGKRAAVPGYYVAGKTGTAQIPNPNGPGYLANATIGSFAGFAPASDPAFIMLVKINHPRTVQFAEASAAPVFGNMARFLLNYLQIEPERPVGELPLEPLPLIDPTVDPIIIIDEAVEQGGSDVLENVTE